MKCSMVLSVLPPYQATGKLGRPPRVAITVRLPWSIFPNLLANLAALSNCTRSWSLQGEMTTKYLGRKYPGDLNFRTEVEIMYRIQCA